MNELYVEYLIGGGTGFIGKHLRTLLTKKGYEVTNISRKAGPEAITWEELERDGFPGDTDAVVNLAGEFVMNFFTRFDVEFKGKLRASRIQTTEMLAQLISKAKKPPRLFISSSAIGYYKSSPTAEYTEDSPFVGENFMSRLCRDWEAAATLPESVKCRHVCVRIGLVHGRDGGVVQSMILPFWFCLGGRIGTGKQWYPWVHIDDVTGIIVHAIENENVTGVLNAVAPQAATNEDFTKEFATALGRPAFIPVPGLFLDSWLGPDRAEMLLEGPKVIPKRTLESGYDFKYPDLTSACKEFAHLL